MLNSELLMQHLSGRCQTVRGAAPVAHHRVPGGIVLVMVDAHHNRQVVVLPGGGNNDALSAAVGDMHRRFLPLGEEAGGLNHHVYPGITPRDIRRVAFAKYHDPLAVYLQRTVTRFNGRGQFAQKGIVFQQMGEGFAVRQIVNGHNLQIRVAQRRAQDITSDTAETVNTDLNHGALLISVVWSHCRRRAVWRKRQKRIRLRHLAAVKALAVFAGREVKLFLKDAA